MIVFDAIQAAVLGVLLLYSVAVAVRKLAPESTRVIRGRLASRLDSPRHAILTRRIGRWLQPPQARRGQCGDGDGCGTCGGCAPSPEIEADAPLPITLRNHKHR